MPTFASSQRQRHMTSSTLIRPSAGSSSSISRLSFPAMSTALMFWPGSWPMTLAVAHLLRLHLLATPKRSHNGTPIFPRSSVLSTPITLSLLGSSTSAVWFDSFSNFQCYTGLKASSVLIAPSYFSTRCHHPRLLLLLPETLASAPVAVL